MTSNPRPLCFRLPLGYPSRQDFKCFLFTGKNVGLLGVGNKMSQVRRLDSEFEILTPPVVLLSFGKIEADEYGS